jgi:hypothetical protein
MPLYDQVLSFIAEPRAERFEPLALEVFRHQFNAVPAYREYCISLAVSPAQVTSIDQIPAVSTLAFKFARLARAEQDDGARVFLTSGTTIGGERGRHVVPRPEIYRASALAHMRRMLFADGARMRVLALHPTAERMPESSLSQMISWCVEEFATRSECAADRQGVDARAAVEFIRAAQRDAAAVCILGTTASLGAVFSHLERHAAVLKLSAGSRLMDTGGAKGQATPMDAAAVCARAEKLLGIAPAMVINEYGMTELCSQLYDATAFNSDDASTVERRVKIAPPWMRAAAVDPVTLAPVARGEIGMLRFFDLANVGSVSAVLTEDFGIVDGDRVRVMGRAGVAEPRGCALAIAEFEAAELARAGR